MTQHRETIEQYPGTLAELADDVSNLRYDALVFFLQSLHRKLESDSVADHGRGRLKLSSALHSSADHLNEAAEAIEQAWTICAPHMK